MLKLVVILFVLDVGVRRIQIDRDEWLKATATLRRWIFFWHGQPRPVEAEVSLATLLAKRGEVRTTRTAAGEARPELFRPEQSGQPVDLSTGQVAAAPPRVETKSGVEAKPAEGEKPVGTTSRLLEAKKRAQKRRGQ